MSYIDPDQFHGVIDEMITHVSNNAATLTTGGLDPSVTKNKLLAIRDDVAGKKNIRDAKKTDLTVAVSESRRRVVPPAMLTAAGRPVAEDCAPWAKVSVPAWVSRRVMSSAYRRRVWRCKSVAVSMAANRHSSPGRGG